MPKYKLEDIVIVRSWKEIKIWFNENKELTIIAMGFLKKINLILVREQYPLLVK